MKQFISNQRKHYSAVGASVFAAVVAPVYVSAQAAANKINEGMNQAGGSSNTQTLPNFIGTIIDILLFIIGAVAVIMIIVGGIRYVTSGGDQSNTKAAKDTILYAVIGLIVAILAYAIVRWVVNNVR